MGTKVQGSSLDSKSMPAIQSFPAKPPAQMCYAAAFLEHKLSEMRATCTQKKVSILIQQAYLCRTLEIFVRFDIGTKSSRTARAFSGYSVREIA